MTEEIKPEQAKEVITKEMKEREEKCSQAIKKALEDNKCVMDVAILVMGRGNMPQIKVTAQP